MQLHIRSVPYSETTFPEGDAWAITPQCAPEEVDIQEVSTAPGEHSLEDCLVYEGQWRERVTSVITALKGEERTCLVWAYGPLESDGVLLIMRYVDYWIDKGTRYHFQGVTYPGGRGYCSTWVTFEFDSETFEVMMRNESLELEYNRLSMILCAHELIGEMLEKPFQKIGVRWILEHDAIALSFISHFEGCYVFGRKATVTRALDRVRSLPEPKRRRRRRPFKGVIERIPAEPREESPPEDPGA